jgi:hypothetical protein
MPLNLTNYKRKTAESVMAFWGNREKARQKQVEAGKTDRGERAAVTGGKNMDGFIALVIDIVHANGLKHASVHKNRRLLTLPGFFRPTKLWDLVVLDKGELIAALEMKSHIGPSFGNNCNNRAEEAVGQGHDFQTAFREGAFGKQPPPFVGWMILVEDAAKSRRPVRDKSPHFQVFPEFQGASYLQRYEILCERLVLKQLYTSACVMTSKREAIKTGDYEDMSELTSFRTFVTSLAGHCASAAARLE